MAETTFLLTSDEWVLIRPSAAALTSIIGDTLWIDAATDLDSIVVSWGDSTKHHTRIRNLGIEMGAKIEMNTFRSHKVVKKEGEKSDDGKDLYELQVTNITVPNSHKLKADRGVIDQEMLQREKLEKQEKANLSADSKSKDKKYFGGGGSGSSGSSSSSMGKKLFGGGTQVKYDQGSKS